MPGDVTLGLDRTPGLPIVPGLDTPGLVVPGVVRAGFVVVALGVPPIDELPMEDPGVVPVIGCGVEPNVPVIGAPVPGVPPMFGLLMPGAVLESMVGELLNVPEPVIGAGPKPGVAPKVPVVPDGATGDTPVVPGAAPTAPVPPAAPRAAVWAKAAGAAAINAAANAGTMDFRLSMRVSFEIAERKALMPQAACLRGVSPRRVS
jgi:hypothetical protein